MKKLMPLIIAPMLLTGACSALADDPTPPQGVTQTCEFDVYDAQSLYSKWKSGTPYLSEAAHKQLQHEWWTIVNCKNDNLDPSGKGKADKDWFQNQASMDYPF